jgi:transposase
MLSLPPGIQVYMAVEPVDMRKSFDGLSAAVEAVFDRNVLDGHLFLFLNKRRDRLKLLWWNGDGLAIFATRLEQGTYEVPQHTADTKQLRLDATQLALLLGGVELRSVKRRPRYVRPSDEPASEADRVLR